MMAETTVQTSQGVKTASKRRRFPALWVFLQNRKAVVGLIIFALFLLVAILAPWISMYDPHDFVGEPWQPPSHQFLFGTTDQGQDVYSQWVWGTRTSLYVGLCSGLISTVLATFVGILGGYKGGWVDTLLNALTNIMLVIPGLPLILVIATYARSSGPNTIIWVIGLTGWAYGARQKRAQALTFASRDFVLAAKLSGMSDLRIILTEILPNMLSFVFNSFIFATIGGIMAEAFLEFIGLGSQQTPSWGNMLNWAQHGQALLNGGWWWFVPPGLSIALIGLSFTLINFALDEISNPRLRKLPKLKNKRTQGVKA
jgi:peptide/nickel transport system permease protein